MKRIFSGILLTTVALLSCKRSGDNRTYDFSWVDTTGMSEKTGIMPVFSKNTTCINLKDLNLEHGTKLSNIADSVNIIQLETSTENIIGKIEKISLQKDKIYILDRMKNPGIYVFSDTGKYICRIGQKGPGPEEYIEPTDFDIYGDSVFILDQFKAKLLIYSTDGTFISEARLPIIATGISVVNDSTFLFNSIDADNSHLGEYAGCNLFTTDQDFNIVKAGFKRKHGLYTSVWIPSNFIRSGKGTNYHPAFGNTIYNITPNGDIYANYIIDFGNRELPEKFTYEENWSEFISDEIQKRYLIFPGDFVTSDNWLLFEFLDNHESRFCYHNRLSGKTLLTYGFGNDINDIPVGKFYASKGDTLISAISSDMIELWRDNMPENDREIILSGKYYNLIRNMTSDNNPLLLLTKLKSK